MDHLKARMAGALLGVLAAVFAGTSADAGRTDPGTTRPPGLAAQAVVRSSPHRVELAVPAPVPVLVARSGAEAHTMRIPAVAVTGRGTVVVAYDRRNLSAADLPGNIDVQVRRSHDEGRSWSAATTVAAHDGGNTPTTAAGKGDPQLLYDRITGRLWLFCIAAPPRIGLFNSSTADTAADPTTVHPRAYWSDDDGTSWSTGLDLTAAWKPPAATAAFAASGHGLQLEDGTLVVPFAYRAAGVSHAALAYSTDHGRTWRRAGDITSAASEHHLVQLGTHDLFDDAREVPRQGSRIISHTTSIFTPWTSTRPAGLPDPGNNADLIQDPAHPGWLLESSTADPTARRHLTVHVSRDHGRTWTTAWAVDPAACGYSTMTALPSGRLGILYETPQGLVWRTHTLIPGPA